jgi:hypothetical protein
METKLTENYSYKITEEFSGLRPTFTEDMHYFCMYAADRTKVEPHGRQTLLEEHKGHIQHPRLKEILDSYHAKAESLEAKPGSTLKALFDKGKDHKSKELLKDHLIQCHAVYLEDVVGKDHASRYLKTEGISGKNGFIELQTQTLLSGSTLYSSEVAAKELQSLREVIRTKALQVEKLTEHNKELSSKLQVTKGLLANFAQNVKNTLGLGDDKLNDLINMPATPSKTKAQEVTQPKTQDKSKGVSM